MVFGEFVQPYHIPDILNGRCVRCGGEATSGGCVLCDAVQFFCSLCGARLGAADHFCRNMIPLSTVTGEMAR